MTAYFPASFLRISIFVCLLGISTAGSARDAHAQLGFEFCRTGWSVGVPFSPATYEEAESRARAAIGAWCDEHAAWQSDRMRCEQVGGDILERIKKWVDVDSKFILVRCCTKLYFPDGLTYCPSSGSPGGTSEPIPEQMHEEIEAAYEVLSPQGLVSFD